MNISVNDGIQNPGTGVEALHKVMGSDMVSAICVTLGR